MPELSVIMGVYNCPAMQMLDRAIDSILNQTFSDFEFIICDDGSVNDTLKWLKEKAAQDERITVIESGMNHGLADALNRCLEKATGRFIARQDIDDYSSPTRFETELKFLYEHSNIAFVGTACFVYDNNGLYGEWHKPEYPSKQDFLFNSPFVHGSMMFSREVFDRCGGYRLIGRCRKYEDYAFFMHAYAQGFQGANIDQLLYTFFSEEKKNMVSVRMRLDEYKVRQEGFRELGIGLKRIPYILKPLILILVPNKLLNSLKDNKKNRLMHKKSLFLRLYKVIVNRNTYIKTNYERFVNGNRIRHRRFPFLSWIYLLKLNLEYAFSKHEFHAKERDRDKINKRNTKEYEKKDYITDTIEKLCLSEAVSFDLYDTLLFRPFSVPSDIFYCVGERLNYPDFKTIRIEAENTMREKIGAGLTLKGIYDFIEERTGIESKTGCRIEQEVEEELAMPNPVMKRIWDGVRAHGRKIIVTTDMYQPKEFIGSLLEKKGFTGAEEIFVSCECGMGKHEGTMYEYIKKIMDTDSLVHIGDNRISDIKNARKHGFKTIEYRNVNLYGNKFRPKDMPQAVGSAYSGLVNARLYRGDTDFSPAYEYGYKYGGILLIGLCEHIHRLATKSDADGVLILSEGGYMVKRIYEEMYPGENAKYIYWSERAAVKMGAEQDFDGFVKYFVLDKIGKGLSIYDVMNDIGVADWKLPMPLNEELNDGNASDIVHFLKQNKRKILQEYESLKKAAKLYIADVLENSGTDEPGTYKNGFNVVKSVISGANKNVTYICAGSATSGRAGQLFSKWMESCSDDPCTIENMIYGENDIYNRLLFGSPEPVFLEYRMKAGYELLFEEKVSNELYIREIQKGEQEFVTAYLKYFNNYEIIRHISLNNARKPFEQALENERHYIDTVFAECIFDK